MFFLSFPRLLPYVRILIDLSFSIGFDFLNESRLKIFLSDQFYSCRRRLKFNAVCPGLSNFPLFSADNDGVFSLFKITDRAPKYITVKFIYFYLLAHLSFFSLFFSPFLPFYLTFPRWGIEIKRKKKKRYVYNN